MRYLVLGASGFIGTHLTQTLLQNGDYVSAFDIKKNDQLKHRNLSFVEGYFSPDYDYESLVDGHNIVFHLISTTLPSSNIDLKTEIEENVFSTLSLLEACVKKKISRIIFVSSGGTVYGNTDIEKPFSETDLTLPISSYGIQKLMIEKYLHLYFHKFNLDYRVVRLSNPYGPGQNSKGAVGAISVFLDKIMNELPITFYGDGSSVRDYIYIDDAIQGLINISNDLTENKVYNLGSGVGTTLQTILNEIVNIVGKEPQIIYLPQRVSDANFSVLNTCLYQEIFNNHKFIDLRTGIASLYQFKKSED